MSKSKAPKPSPAQERLANSQADAYYQMMDMNRDQFALQSRLALTQEERSAQEFARQNSLSDLSMQWGLQDRQRGDAFYDASMAYDPVGDARANAEQWRGEAGAQSQQAVSAGLGQMNRGLQRMGVNPNSGKYVALGQQAQIEGALGTAANINNASRAGDMAIQAAKAEKLNVQGMASGRANAGGYLGMTSQFGLAGLGAGGTGMNAYSQAWSGFNQGASTAGNFAQGANAGFNDIYQQKLQRSQSSGGIGGALGSIAGTAIGGFAGSYGAGLGASFFPKK